LDKLVSVIIPSYNQVPELINAIKSVINQSYADLEIIVIDDCSSQNVKYEIDNIKDDRIQFYKTEKNSGVIEARKLGFIKSTGNYITFLDHDDIFTTNCIENKINIFSGNDKINMVLSDYIENNLITNSNKIHKMESFASNFNFEIYKNPGPFFQSCMFKRELFEELNLLLDKNAIPSEDWDFFINLSKFKLNIGYVNSPDFVWNLSEESQSANYQKEALALKYILKKHKKTFLKKIGNVGLSDHYRMVARIYEKGKFLKEAKGIYKLAFKIYPRSIKNIFYKLISIFPDSIFMFIAKIIRDLRGKPLG